MIVKTELTANWIINKIILFLLPVLYNEYQFINPNKLEGHQLSKYQILLFLEIIY